MKVLNKFFSIILLLALGTGLYVYFAGIPNSYRDILSPKAHTKTVPNSDSNSNLNSTQNPNPTQEKPKTSPNALQPLPTNPYARIDQHARKAPESAAKDIPTLARYLEQGTQTDLEKARSIYVWLTDNITYDDDSFNSNDLVYRTIQEVLDRRTAVCDGFSRLYLALGLEMGLEIEKVVGYAKGYGYQPGSNINDTDHAWNVIQIDGNWRVFDATWGQGNGTNVNGKLVSEKKFKDYWFNVDPYEAIFNHLPEEREFMMVEPPLSLSKYSNMPFVRGSFFDLGFDGEEIYRKAYLNPGYEFPEVYSVDTHIEVIQAPDFKNLQLGQTYTFQLYIPRGLEVAAIDANNEWKKVKGKHGKFEFTYTPQTKGELKINVKHKEGGKMYHGILQYAVGAGQRPI